MSFQKKNNCVIFLDRDGVIIRDPNFVLSKKEIEILPSAPRGLKYLQKLGHRLVIISNQAAVARGLLDLPGLWEIDEEIKKRLQKKGIVIEKSFYCPHHPEFTGLCSCRKPEPGLLLQAANELKIDLGSSYVIGDKKADIEAGKRAGCKGGILVKKNEEYWDKYSEPSGIVKAENLWQAAKMLGEGLVVSWDK